MSIPVRLRPGMVSFFSAGGLPILNGSSQARDLRQFKIFEAQDHLRSWRLVKQAALMVLVDSVLRKQNDVAQMSCGRHEPSSASLCAFGAVLPSLPWRDTGSEFNCKWALEFFSPSPPHLLRLDFHRFLKPDKHLAFLSATPSQHSNGDQLSSSLPFIAPFKIPSLRESETINS